METRLQNLLIDMGISPSLKGFRCICEAVKMIVESESNPLIVKEVYPVVGNMFNIRWQTVERRIRYAILYAGEDRVKECLNCSTRNADFLFTLALKIKQEGK